MSYERKRSNTPQKIFLTEGRNFYNMFAIDIDILEYSINMQLCNENFPTRICSSISTDIKNVINTCFTNYPNHPIEPEVFRNQQKLWRDNIIQVNVAFDVHSCFYVPPKINKLQLSFHENKDHKINISLRFTLSSCFFCLILCIISYQ